MQFSQLVAQLATLAGTTLESSSGSDPQLTGVAAVDEAIAGQISFLDEDNSLHDWIERTAASALILPKDADLIARAEARGLAWVVFPQPRLAFAAAIGAFYRPFRPQPGIHPSAVIDPGAHLGYGISIGANVVIHADVTVGDGAILHANVVVYPGCSIGAGSQLHANCTLHERTILGQGCVVHSGAVVGAEGFGFVPTREGWFKMEQSGCVVLEDGVEVGCNSTIDRPAVGETRIGRQTKIDNLVHIGHGCRIGEACAMAAQVGMAGGVEVGNRVILAGKVGVANKVKIGDGAIASSKSGLHSTIAAGEVVSGYPAIPNRLWLKASAVYNKLPELYKQVRSLQKRLDALEPRQ